jgi:hypothetical protein
VCLSSAPWPAQPPQQDTNTKFEVPRAPCRHKCRAQTKAGSFVRTNARQAVPVSPWPWSGALPRVTSSRPPCEDTKVVVLRACTCRGRRGPVCERECHLCTLGRFTGAVEGGGRGRCRGRRCARAPTQTSTRARRWVKRLSNILFSRGARFEYRGKLCLRVGRGCRGREGGHVAVGDVVRTHQRK